MRQPQRARVAGQYREYHCAVCGHRWVSNLTGMPRQCRRCWARHWMDPEDPPKVVPWPRCPECGRPFTKGLERKYVGLARRIARAIQPERLLVGQSAICAYMGWNSKHWYKYRGKLLEDQAAFMLSRQGHNRVAAWPTLLAYWTLQRAERGAVVY